MKKKILLVLTHQNLSKYLYKKLGVGINYNNYQIVYWNLLPLLNKNLDKQTLQKIKKKNYINIKSLNILWKESKLLPSNFFYWNTCGYEYLSSICERFLFFIGGKKIYIESGSHPDTSKSIKKNYLNYIKAYLKESKYFLYIKIKSKIFITIKNFICKNIFTPATNIYFTTNERTFLYYKKISNGKPVFKIDGTEMAYLKDFNKNKNKNKNKIVFIDQELENPFDLKLNYSGIVHIYKTKDYWSKLNILFDQISKRMKNYIIDIAAHPRRAKKNFPSRRKFIFNKTLQLIAESKLVLGHHSLALHYAILLRKPMLFVYSNKQTRVGENEAMFRIAKETGTTTLNFDNIIKKKIKLNLKKILKINEKKYENYENKYICFKNQTPYGRWKTILKNLVNIN